MKEQSQLWIAFPFAAVGAAAGWLFTQLLMNPLVDASLPGKQGLATAIGATAGAALGAVIGGSREAREGVVEAARVAGGSVCVSVLAGAAIGAVANPTRIAAGLGGGLIGGLVCGLVFAPVCVVVAASARRSARARLGSIVASVDRRGVVSVLASAVGVMTLLAAPDWPLVRDGNPHAFVALAMLFVCALAVAVAVVFDAVAARRLERIQRDADDMTEVAGDATRSADASEVDVGVGDELVARLAGGDAYRGGERAVALVHGDASAAGSAARAAVRRGALCMIALGLVAAMHYGASTTAAALAFYTERCDQGDLAYCAALADVTADLGEQAAPACSGSGSECTAGSPTLKFPNDLARYMRAHPEDVTASGRHEKIESCLRGDADECHRATEIWVTKDQRLIARLHGRACALGRSMNCYFAGNAFLDARTEEDLSPDAIGLRAVSYYERGCEEGIVFGCCEAVELRLRGPTPLRNAERARRDFELNAKDTSIVRKCDVTP